jgi:hypothetical protein
MALAAPVQEIGQNASSAARWRYDSVDCEIHAGTPAVAPGHDTRISKLWQKSGGSGGAVL